MSIGESPLAIAERLKPIERQWLDLTLLRGLGLTLVGLGTPLVLWLLTDLFLNLPGIVRFAGLLSILVSGGLACFFGLVRPLVRGIRTCDLAAWVEQAEPQMQERIRTCLELEAQDLPASRAARLMQRQVRRETWDLLDDVDWSTVLPQDGAYRTLGIGLIVVALVISPTAIWMSGYGLSWQRLLAPAGNWGWGRNYRIAAAPGDRVVARHSEVTILATAHARRGGLPPVEQLTLKWRAQGESLWDERRLIWSEENQSFTAILPRLSDDTEFQIHGPAAVSPRYHLRVVDPPALTSLSAAVDPPAYMGLPSKVEQVGADLVVMEGSRVMLNVEFDHPVTSVDIEWPDSDSSVATVASEVISADGDAPGHTARIHLTAKSSGLFVLRWKSPEGFLGESPPRRLEVIPDQPPITRIEGAGTITLRPDDRQAIEIMAADDFGLTVAELHLSLNEKPIKIWPLARTNRRQRSGQWSQTIDLQSLGLKPSSAAMLRSRVVDNRTHPAPQERWSDPVTLVVSDSATSAEARELLSQTDATRQELQRLMRELNEQRKDLRELHQKTAAATVKQKDAEQAERLAQLEEQQAALNQQFQNWREQLPQNSQWEEIRQQADALQKADLASAQEQIQQAQSSLPREQIEQLSRSLDDLATAQKSMQQLDDSIRALGNRSDEIDRLTQLANQSDRLAERLDQNSSVDDDRPVGRSPESQSAEAGDPQVDSQTPSNNRADMERQQAESLNQDLQQLLQDQPQLQEAVQAHQQQQMAAVAQELSQLADQQRTLSEQLARSAEMAPASAIQVENNPADVFAPQNLPQPESQEFQQGQSLAQQAEAAAQTAQGLAEQKTQLENQTNPEDTAAQSVAQQTRAAADAIAQAQLAEAAQAVNSAAEELSAMSAEPSAQSPQTQEQAARLQQQLEDLQLQLADALASSEQQRGAQAQAQQMITNSASQLSQQLAEMSSQADTPSAVAQANKAVEQAQPQQQATQTAIAQSDTQAAIQNSEAAAESLENAAEQLQSLAGNRNNENSTTSPTGAALTDAQNRLQRASQKLQASNGPTSNETVPSDSSANSTAAMTQTNVANGSPSASKSSVGAENQPLPPDSRLAAAEDFRAAANALRQAARSMSQGSPSSMGQPSQPRMPNQPNNQPGRGQGGNDPNQVAPSDTAAALNQAPPAQLIGSPRNWGRLQGELKTELLDGGALSTHPEYQRQIQRYFETIARPDLPPVTSAKE